MIFTKKQHVYLIGIKGVGMTALAVILKQLGLEVSGSDVAKPFITDIQLKTQEIPVFEGFSADRIAELKPDIIIIGASWGEEHEEVRAARASDAKILLYSEALGELSRMKRTVAVAGTHGKTTTTSIMAFLLQEAGKNPSYVIGTGTIRGLEGNGAWNDGKHFIVEADDYKKAPTIETPKFMDLEPAVVILTSCEYDHPDFFKSLADTEMAFSELLRNVSEHGYAVAFVDDPAVKRIAEQAECDVETYGETEAAAWRIKELTIEEKGTRFLLERRGESLGEFVIPFPGQQYAWNATAAIVTAIKEGVKVEEIRSALAKFSGAQRRFDVHEAKGVIFVDDYAHHPTAIRLTLEAARKRWPKKKIWCFYQPHQVSRTEALYQDFARAFGAADKVLLVDIFASAREKKHGITSKELARSMKKHHKDVEFVGDIEKARAYLEANYKKADVIFTMGAGDIYEIAEQFYHV